jgi:RecA/RadA recombinase
MQEPKKQDSGIEEKFKNPILEIRIAAYMLRVDAQLSLSIKEDWFSIFPLRDIWKVSKFNRVTLTYSSVLHELEKLGIFKEKNIKDIYLHFLKQVYKISLTNVTKDNIRLMVKQLYDLSSSRKMFFVIKDIVSNVDSFNVEKARKKLKPLIRDEFAGVEALTGNYLDDFETRRDDLLNKQGTDFCIKTGISKLDWQIGGIMPGELGVILGRTGLGKTAMMVCMAVYAWLAGFNVAFATGEMSTAAIEYRIDSNLTGISGNKFRLVNFEDVDLNTWKVQIESLRLMQQSFLEVAPFTRGFNTDNITDWLNRIQDKHGKQVHVLFVDYVNIMEAVKRKEDKQGWQSQTDTMWDLKTLSQTFNNGIGVWTPCQVKNEDLYADTLNEGSSKYAGSISETAQILMGLVQTQEDILFNTMQLQMIKMRNVKVPREPIILYPNLDVMRMNNQVATRCKDLLEEESIDNERKEAIEKRKTTNARKRK